MHFCDGGQAGLSKVEPAIKEHFALFPWHGGGELDIGGISDVYIREGIIAFSSFEKRWGRAYIITL